MVDPFDVAAQLLPPIPAGNPAAIAQRRRERDIQLALDGLPPATTSPFAYWESGIRALVLDEMQRFDELEALFRSLPPREQNILDLFLPAPAPELAARTVREHPHSALAKLRHAIVLLETADVDSTDAFAQISGGSYRIWARDLVDEVISDLGEHTLWPWRLLEAAAYAEQDDEAMAQFAARWQAVDPLDPVCAIRHVRYVAARSSLTAGIDEAVRIVQAAPEGDDIHALIPYAIGLAVEMNRSPQPYLDTREAILDAYAHSLGSAQAYHWYFEDWARHQFAGALHCMGEADLAWAELKATRGHVQSSPWEFLSDKPPLEFYDELREFYLRRELGLER